ncbi:MAG TPA: hypothetical protein VKD72_12280 [Gemmataceae bacterium]|nr:hypothetical protein [Gemmataceae bacterium]
MPSEPFYRLDPSLPLSQGDIWENVPQLQRLRPPIQVLRKATLSKGREGYEAHAYPGGEGPSAESAGQAVPGPAFDFKKGEPVPVGCQVARAVVLSYDCDLDNDPDHCLVALVRSFVGLSDGNREVIRGNRNFSFFYLPAEAALGLDESYVDFRRLTAIHPQTLSLAARRASLGQEAVDALRAQLVRFFTRRELG